MERVIIRLGNGIKFVVVAAGAGNGQAEKGLRGDINPVVDDVVGVPVEMVADGQKPERGQGAPVAPKVHFVRSELFEDKPVVRLVVVERLDDVIAKSPRIRINGTFAAPIELALRVRVTGHVEPVPPPAFAVVGRGQQAVHDLFKREWRVVIEKLDRLLGSWRQADQIVVGAANQSALVGRFVRCHPFFLELGQDEAIQVVFDPGYILYGGRLGFMDGLECPVVLAVAAVGRRLRGRPRRP